MSSRVFFKTLATASVLAIGLAAPSLSFAQTVPGSADEGRVDKRIRTDGLPAVAGERVVNVPNYVVGSAPAGAEKVSLTLREVVVEGSSVYSEAELATIYSDVLGKKVTLRDVFGYAERLTAKYRNDGYILSQVVVPPQEIDNGVVRYQVVEGYINNVTLEGDLPTPVRKTIMNMANKLTGETALNSKSLERYLLLMNDLPGFTVRSVLSASQTEPGAADLTLIAERKLVDVVAQLDNRGSRFLGPLQASVATRFNSVFGFGEALDFQIVASPDGHPDNELEFFSADFTKTVTSEGTQFNIGASYTETEPGFTLSQFDIKGRSRNLHIGITHPLIRTRNENFFVSATLDLNEITRGDNIPASDVEDRIRALRLGAIYQFTDRYIGVNTLDVTVSKGFDLFNGSDAGDANLSRPNGRAEFTKVEAQISRLQRVTDKVSLFAAAKGQYTNHLLLSSEEFGVGGADFGRAYDSSEIVGEEGVATVIELQINDPVPAPVIDGYQLYTYYDFGFVRDPDNTVVKDRRRSLASIGTGVRFDVNETVSGSAEMALPLTREVQTQNDDDVRGFFALTARF